MPLNILAALLLDTHALALLVGVYLGSRYNDRMRRDPGGLRFALCAGCLLLLVATWILAARG